MTRRRRNTRRWARPKMPRYTENQEEDRAAAPIVCHECRLITTPLHNCDPVCGRCDSHFLPGHGCSDLCDATPCCGCCHTAEMSTDAAVSHEADVLHPQIQFPDLRSTMHLLVDFLFSDRESQVKINHGNYKTVITAIGGREAFVRVMYETVNSDIKALEGQIITPSMLHAIRQKQATTGKIWKDPHGGYLDFVTHVHEHTYLRLYVVQGISLSPQTRHQIAENLRQSPDPEIRRWPDIRKDRQISQNSGSDELPSRRYMDKESYYDAIHRAIKSSSCMEESTSIQVDEEMWAPFEGELVDPQSWAQSTLDKLQWDEDETVSPVGTSEACIGVVFETTPLQDYNENGKLISVPWGLRESGFKDTNSLIWPFDLRKYANIPGTFQVAPHRPADSELLHDATQELIAGSRLRIVIMCGDIEDTIVPRHAKAVTLTLNDMTYNSWIETRQHKVARIFIRASIPLSELLACHGRRAFELSTIFLFVSAMTDVKIYPTFYESAMALTLIVRGIDNERKGKICQASPADIEPIIRIWLADKGFKTDEDLLRLAEAADGSLRYGILVLGLVLSNRKGKEPLPRKVPPSKTKQRDVVPTEILDKVRSLRKEICGHQWTYELKTEPILQQRTDELETEPILQQWTDEMEIESIFQAVETFIDNEEDHDVFSTGPALGEILSERDSPISFKVRFGLMTGNRYQINKAGPRKSFTIRHCTIFFTMTEPHNDGFFWVKAEMSPKGERHPHAWATTVRDQDPGARLAFRVYLKDEDNNLETWSTYPSCSTWEASCQANSLADAFEGDNYLDICQRPRRYIYIDERDKGLTKKYPELIPFVRGAYTGDDMQITPTQGRLRGTKQKRRNDPDTSEIEDGKSDKRTRTEG
ncbi:hypothetical protein BJX63DRAFT_441250 [Aspergillus granulosus]|uniref:Uncharacterized protein n=1 Tax=Aspergillus granulosus TaxID=176169 RepID=A0ABR4I4G2_9EURO